MKRPLWHTRGPWIVPQNQSEQLIKTLYQKKEYQVGKINLSVSANVNIRVKVWSLIQKVTREMWDVDVREVI